MPRERWGWATRRIRHWTCEVDLTDLELDQRLRDHTPAEYDELWDVFKPRGRVNAAVHLVREPWPANR